jgi:dipeptidase E
VPFQINPHYFHGKTHYEEDGEMKMLRGETRADRIREFHCHNDTPVIALDEGCILRCEDGEYKLTGLGRGYLFTKGADMRAFGVGEKMSVPS